jgi:hypothetical protein
MIEMNEFSESSTPISRGKPLKERPRLTRPQNDMTTGSFVLTLIFVAALVAPYTDHLLVWLLAPLGLVVAGIAVEAPHQGVRKILGWKIRIFLNRIRRYRSSDYLNQGVARFGRQGYS